jgi:hypothetical protein
LTHHIISLSLKSTTQMQLMIDRILSHWPSDLVWLGCPPCSFCRASNWVPGLLRITCGCALGRRGWYPAEVFALMTNSSHDGGAGHMHVRTAQHGAT